MAINNTTRLIPTSDYVTTAYGSMNYYKCTSCGYDEILNEDNFCPHCGKKIIYGDISYSKEVNTEN